jgi:hypothetical protein
MNSLSWLIYIVEIGNNLSVVCILIAVSSLILTALIWFAGLMVEADLRKPFPQRCKQILKWSIPICMISGMLAVFMPSRETVLLIAASEIGERALHTDSIQAMGNKLNSVVDPSVELLNTWIRKQTQELAHENSNNSK